MALTANSSEAAAADDWPDDPGGSVWAAYLEDSSKALELYAQYSSGIMTGILTFAGLFGAIVAAFLMESLKSLKPDPAEESRDVLKETRDILNKLLSATLNGTESHIEAVDPPPFRPDATAVIVNRLWSTALAISLMAALLATLYQEWATRLVSLRDRSKNRDLEAHAIHHIQRFSSAYRYGFDSVAPLVIGLMHFAVILFLLGLVLYLRSLDPDPAYYVFLATGTGAIVYSGASLLPMRDPTCIYRTPLTAFLTLSTAMFVSFVVVVVLYAWALCKAAAACLSRGRPSETWSRALEWKTWGEAWDPFHISTSVYAMAVYRWRGGESQVGMPLEVFIGTTIETGQMPPVQAPLGEFELNFLVQHVGWMIVDYPAFMRHLVLDLLDVGSPAFGAVFVQIRRRRHLVRKIAIGLCEVESPNSAVGALRLLQVMLLARWRLDTVDQSRTRDEYRWEMMDPIFQAAPRFVARLIKADRQAMGTKDLSVRAALCSLRWSLLILWDDAAASPSAPSLVNDRIRDLLRSFEHHNDVFALLPFSTYSSLGSDQQNMAPPFYQGEIPIREVAALNSFLLLEAALQCDWSGWWAAPDVPYLKEEYGPGMWEWDKEFSPLRKFSSSPFKVISPERFGQLLRRIDARPGTWTDGNIFVIPLDVNVPSFAIRALYDLSKMVNLTALHRSLVKAQQEYILCPAPEDMHLPESREPLDNSPDYTVAPQGVPPSQDLAQESPRLSISHEPLDNSPDYTVAPQGVPSSQDLAQESPRLSVSHEPLGEGANGNGNAVPQGTPSSQDLAPESPHLMPREPLVNGSGAPVHNPASEDPDSPEGSEDSASDDSLPTDEGAAVESAQQTPFANGFMPKEPLLGEASLDSSCPRHAICRIDSVHNIMAH
ncbi:unnamed protein product [Peniophora sp. CBMAI 1063]|nr:unnamed protein product [Peniophora sp. CBMAI 1063]